MATASQRSGGSQITFQNYFGALAGAGSAHIRTSTNSKITATGNYAVSGGAGYHWNAQLGGLLEISGRTVTFSSSPAITIFAYCLQASVMYIFNNTYTNGNTVTGQQYIATTAGVIETLTGATLPGSTGGSATSPGIKT